VVVAACREAAFVPESSPGLLGHILGSTLAALTIRPKGLVEGEGNVYLCRIWVGRSGVSHRMWYY
jgi:hypothetical protein